MAATHPMREATPNASTYVRPQDMEWKPTRFDGISIKVLYENPDKGEMTCPAQVGAGCVASVSTATPSSSRAT